MGYALSDCTRCKELENCIREILAWKDSPGVTSAFFNAWMHGQVATKEEASSAERMWERAKKLAGDPE